MIPFRIIPRSSTYFLKALQRTPKWPQSHFRAGACSAGLGDTKTAAKRYEEFSTLWKTADTLTVAKRNTVELAIAWILDDFDAQGRCQRVIGHSSAVLGDPMRPLRVKVRKSRIEHLFSEMPRIATSIDHNKPIRTHENS